MHLIRLALLPIFLCCSAQAQDRLPIFVSTAMDSLSRQLEQMDSWKEVPASRKAMTQPGYLLVTAEMGYTGGSGKAEYFTLFSAGTEKSRPQFIGWETLGEWLTVGGQQPFSVQATKGGGRVLQLTIVNSNKEHPNLGKTMVVKYALPKPGDGGNRLEMD